MSAIQMVVIQANGAIVLRSTMKQDKEVDYHTMLAAVKAKHPTAEWCLAYRTYDGDPINQIQIKGGLTGKATHGLIHGQRLEF